MRRPAWQTRWTRTRPVIPVMSLHSRLQADGKILVGGFFQGIGGQPRNSIARLDPMTGLADSFNPNPPTQSSVDSIAVQADGKILVGGFFQDIGGLPRNSIARLDPRPAWQIRSTRTRPVVLLPIQSRCRRTARFEWAAISRASVDSRAAFSLVYRTTSPRCKISPRRKPPLPGRAAAQASNSTALRLSLQPTM